MWTGTSCIVPLMYIYVDKYKVCKCCAVRALQSIRSHTQTDELTHQYCISFQAFSADWQCAGLLIERWQPFSRLLNLASNTHTHTRPTRFHASPWKLCLICLTQHTRSHTCSDKSNLQREVCVCADVLCTNIMNMC